MRLRGLYIHFEIEKISIFLCQKVMRICALFIIYGINARKTHYKPTWKNFGIGIPKCKTILTNYNCVIYYDYDKVPGGGSEWLIRMG